MKVNVCRATTVFILSLSATAHADEALDKQFAELKALGQQYNMQVQAVASGFKVTLPANIPALPGYASKNENGKTVVTFEGDSQYIRCAKRLARTGLMTFGAGLASGRKEAVIGGTAALVQGGYDSDDCITEARERMIDAIDKYGETQTVKGITVKMGDFETKLKGAQGEVKNLNSALLSVESRLKTNLKKQLAEATKKIVTEEQLERIVADKMKSIKEQTAKYFDDLKQSQAAMQKEQERIRKAQQLQADIQTTAQGLTALVGLVVENPKTAQKINNGISGCAQLAQIGVALAGASNPFTAVMLSLSAFGVMNSMFGGGEGTSYDAVILANIQSLQNDINSMRSEIRERFDMIQKSLATLASYMENRFNGIDTKLVAIQTELHNFREDQDIVNSLALSGISYSLTYPFNASVQSCFEGDASKSLSRAAFGNCLGNFKVHATSVARMDLISGGARVPSTDFLGNLAAKYYLSVDASQTLAYASTLDRKIEGRPIEKSPPSPLEWVRGAEAYMAMIERYDDLPNVKREATKKEILTNEKNNVKSIVEAGEQIKVAAETVREEGAISALTLYSKEMEEFSKKLQEELLKHMTKHPLGVTKPVTWRSVSAELVDGHSSLLRACAHLNRGLIGMQDVIATDDDKIVIEEGTWCTSTAMTDKENVDGVRAGQVADAQNTAEEAFPLHRVRTPEDALEELHKRYLERQAVKNYTEQAKAGIPFLINALLQTKEMVDRLARVEYLQQLLLQHVLVGIDNPADPVVKNNVKLIQSLAVKPGQVSVILKNINYKLDAPLKDMFAVEAARVFAEEELRVVAAIKANPPNNAFPFVDRTLSRLRAVYVR